MKSRRALSLLTTASNRLADRIRAWRIDVERITETECSILAFGRRGNQPVVLKVVNVPGDEWHSGAILAAFEGRGVARVYEYADGAVLIERLNPGRSLVTLALNGGDADATRILADVIRRMSPVPAAKAAPTAAELGRSFATYADSGDTQVPPELVATAHRVYLELCRSQTRVRLLHGDLHHSNVLCDDERGWLAVDPKGVVGEVEFEVGAALRNPYERPALFADPSIIRERLGCFVRELDLDAERILSWAFTQAVLATIWAIEDGARIEPDHGWIALANTLRGDVSL